MAKPKPAIIRLIEKTEIDMETGCWLDVYGFKDPDGYTKIYYHAMSVRTNKFSAHFFHNLKLNDLKLQANHKIICKNRNCWNPGHIYVGTQAQNIKDSIKLGTHSYSPYVNKENIRRVK